MPGATSSILATSSDALVTNSDGLELQHLSSLELQHSFLSNVALISTGLSITPIDNNNTAEH